MARKNSPPWFETLEDDIWLRPDEMGSEEAAFIKEALRLRKGQAVLDAPCGAGRIAVHLAQAGCLMTGIDLRPSFIDRACQRFRRERVPGNFSVRDLRDLQFVGAFHGIYNWFSSFGYFSEGENLQVLEGYFRALRSGGRLLIDQLNRERILRKFVAERQDGAILTRNIWEERTQRLEARRIIDGTENPKNRSSIRLYTLGQMSDLFKRVGFAVEAVYGSIEGEAYCRSSRQMLVVGRK